MTLFTLMTLPRRVQTAALALLVLAALTARAPAAQPDTSAEPDLPTHTLTVGTRLAPPYAMRDPDGTWRGIAIELWQRVATDLGLDYEFTEVDLATMIEGVADGRLDLSVGALTMTPEREALIDFTHPFQSAGLAIALPHDAGRGFLSLLAAFPWGRFLLVLFALAGILFVAGALVWIFERRANKEQFGPGIRGLGSGFWWSAVTLTTVGYGDKAPATVGGRAVGLVWMFASVFAISAFTAAVASTLTAQRLTTGIQGPEDLGRTRVGAVADSIAQTYLDDRRLRRDTFPAVEDALLAMEQGDLGAVVHDAPILRHLAAETFSGSIKVLPGEFDVRHYAFAVPLDSDLRKPLNEAILRATTDRWWKDTLSRYLAD